MTIPVPEIANLAANICMAMQDAACLLEKGRDPLGLGADEAVLDAVNRITKNQDEFDLVMSAIQRGPEWGRLYAVAGAIARERFARVAVAEAQGIDVRVQEMVPPPAKSLTRRILTTFEAWEVALLVVMIGLMCL